MVNYRVRSWSLLNLVNDINEKRLIPDAYFQRDLVWREIHKKEFIETILAGLPFPQLFISKGKVDLVEMKTVSCIVDGQQRSNAIIEFINGNFSVHGKLYRELEDIVRTNFLKYEIAIIELDLENDDPRVQEIFQRINRTSNSLRGIEKQASQYATSDFMLVAKLISNQIDLNAESNEYFKEDPRIPPSFYEWAKKIKVPKTQELFTSSNIFTSLEISRKTNLSYALNIMSTMHGGIYHRNEKANSYLEDFSECFAERDNLLYTLEKASLVFYKLKFSKKSYWNNKANFFSVIIALTETLKANQNINIENFKLLLNDFEANTPDEYKIAAIEAVNNLRERRVRHQFIIEMLNKCLV